MLPLLKPWNPRSQTGQTAAGGSHSYAVGCGPCQCALPTGIADFVYLHLAAYPYPGLGIAVFAVGVLYVVDEEFVAVPRFWRAQVIDELDEAGILIDTHGQVRDYNRQAAETFSELSGHEGLSLTEAAPALSEALAAGEDIAVFEGDQSGSADTTR